MKVDSFETKFFKLKKCMKVLTIDKLQCYNPYKSWKWIHYIIVCREITCMDFFLRKLLGYNSKRGSLSHFNIM
jgi:hypothetical protein